MSTARRFEHRDGHYKFWTIWHPILSVDKKGVKSWTNKVHFGSIGTNGQTRTKTFWSESSALSHYNAKVNEKTNKGYKEVTKGAAPQHSLVKPAPKPEPKCEHLQLRKKPSGLQWECNSCKTVIEFDKPQLGAPAIEEDTARRFFDLSAFQQD